MIEKVKEIIDVSRNEWLEEHAPKKMQANAGPPSTFMERILAAVPEYVPLETFGTKITKD